MPLPRNKNCKKGYACGRSCINRSKNCRKRLAGQARNNAEWLKINSTGSSSPQDYILRGRRLLSDEDAAFIDNYAAEADRIQSGLLKYKESAQGYEYVQFVREHFELEYRLKDIRSKILDTSPLSVEEATELVERRVTFTNGEKSRNHLIDVARMTGGRGFDNEFYVLESSGRPWAREKAKTIKVDPGRKYTVFHEVGHNIEFQNNQIGEAAKQWAYGRGYGEPKLLKDITGDERYTSEVGLPGNFIDPYVGRLYPESYCTEVVSMGLEKLSGSFGMGELARDPEHFFFTLGVLRR